MIIQHLLFQMFNQKQLVFTDITQNGGVFFDTEFENIKSNTIDYYDDRKSNRNIIYQTNYSVLDFTTIGTKTMNYTITDSNGNSVTKTRDVTVVDVSDPIIVLNPTQEKYNLGANPAELFIETGYTVTDNYSPQEDITVDIKYFSIGNDPNNNNQPEWTPIINILMKPSS